MVIEGPRLWRLSKRVLVTSEGVVADSIICIFLNGNIAKTWPAKINMVAGRDKLALFVDLLNNFGDLGRIYNTVVHLRGIAEIS